MHTVHKYSLPHPHQESIIQCPEDGIITAVAIQNGVPCLWMWVDTNAPIVSRAFRSFGTGWPILPPIGLLPHFVGTYFEESEAFGMNLVWHLFEFIDAAPFDTIIDPQSADDIEQEKADIAADMRREIVEPDTGESDSDRAMRVLGRIKGDSQ